MRYKIRTIYKYEWEHIIEAESQDEAEQIATTLCENNTCSDCYWYSSEAEELSENDDSEPDNG